jgi:hypothetical protein
MRRLFIFLLGLAASAPLQAQNLASPESVLLLEEGLLVSNLGERPAPTLADGDGFIARLGPDGEVLEAPFLPVDGRLNAPKGLARLENTVYIADIGRVLGFDLASGEQVFELSLESTGTRFLNDLAVADGRLLVSATDIGQIFEIDPKQKAYRRLVRGVDGANGLVYDADNQRLFVAGYGDNGRLGMVDLRGRWPRYRKLGLTGRLDGIALYGEWVIVSDWEAGNLHAYHPLRGHVVRNLLAEPVEGPADFALDAQSGRIFLPLMKENRLLIETISAEMLR